MERTGLNNREKEREEGEGTVREREGERKREKERGEGPATQIYGADGKILTRLRMDIHTCVINEALGEIWGRRSFI